MQAKAEQQRRGGRLRQRLLGLAADLSVHKLQLAVTVTPAAASLLPALAVAALILLIAAARRAPAPSSLDAYRTGVAVVDPPSISAPPRGSAAAAAARVPPGCDIFRPGEWVPDGAAPYYTNLTCSLIQEHQNCMKYGRPDTGFLRWRWRPAGCDLPRFDAEAFLDAVRDSSMAFVGDSLARNHMQSLMCLLTKVAYPKDISKTTHPEFRTMHYESHNFTVAIFWSPFLVRGYQPDPARHMWAIHLDEPDAAWVPGIAGFDRVVLSAANWFARPAMFYEAGRVVGCHSCLAPGVPDLTHRHSLRMAFRAALRALAGPGAAFGGTVIVRTLSPTSHFEGGEWDKGGDCRRTRPLAAGEARVAGLDRDFHGAQVEEFARAKAAVDAGGRGRPRLVLMDTTAAMVLRPDGHPSRYGHWAHENVTLYNDCVHWCLPGPIDAWNEMLLQMLLQDRPS
ncbi:protein trichome birefringence-like 19 [Panicum virgatum]|uniref:protein trichome birefringence-like 19 n=1 Tax=Panicum virgatum TaxID=38727 RepID=UPI0019D5B985|nr:protein trichome birefringence-like 19 [Panicum virgatum]XP_039843433.1 protein trichome birefringence-like 19 [Panicum virgatum]